MIFLKINLNFALCPFLMSVADGRREQMYKHIQLTLRQEKNWNHWRIVYIKHRISVRLNGNYDMIRWRHPYPHLYHCNGRTEKDSEKTNKDKSKSELQGAWVKSRQGPTNRLVSLQEYIYLKLNHWLCLLAWLNEHNDAHSLSLIFRNLQGLHYLRKTIISWRLHQGMNLCWSFPWKTYKASDCNV